MGALPPKYSFALNRHAGPRFTTCPGCRTDTRVRKIPFVIHVDGTGLVILRKTCRLCVNCEIVVVHRDELEPFIAALVGQPVVSKPKYLVLGTVDPRVWRRGASAGLEVDELTQHMSDFRAYLNIEYTPGGWYPSR